MVHPSSTEREDKEGKAKRSLEVKRKGENKQMKKKKKPKTASEQSLVSEKTKKL